MKKYKHKTTGAIYEPKRPVDDGVIFYVSGGNGEHKWMGAYLFMSNSEIANNLGEE